MSHRSRSCRDGRIWDHRIGLHGTHLCGRTFDRPGGRWPIGRHRRRSPSTFGRRRIRDGRRVVGREAPRPPRYRCRNPDLAPRCAPGPGPGGRGSRQTRLYRETNVGLDLGLRRHDRCMSIRGRPTRGQQGAAVPHRAPCRQAPDRRWGDRRRPVDPISWFMDVVPAARRPRRGGPGYRPGQALGARPGGGLPVPRLGGPCQRHPALVHGERGGPCVCPLSHVR